MRAEVATVGRGGKDAKSNESLQEREAAWVPRASL